MIRFGNNSSLCDTPHYYFIDRIDRKKHVLFCCRYKWQKIYTKNTINATHSDDIANFLLVLI